jgi:hypothetical protein
MKQIVRFLSLDAIKEWAVDGKTMTCGVCGGVKSAKAKICKSCASAYTGAVKAVDEAVLAYRQPIAGVDKEWRQIQRECASIEANGDDPKTALKKMYPRFSFELVEKIIGAFHDWQTCCREVKSRLNVARCQNFGKYASLLQNNVKALSRFSHGMILSAVNVAYNEQIDMMREKTARVVDRFSKLIEKVAGNRELDDDQIVSVLRDNGLFGYKQDREKAILREIVSAKVAKIRVLDLVMRSLGQRMVKVRCPDISSEKEKAIRLSLEEMKDQNLLKRLPVDALVVHEVLGINVPLYEIRGGKLVQVGSCTPVFKEEAVVKAAAG